MSIARCQTSETETIYKIINDAAQAYKGIIPDDCYHTPYMSLPALEQEIAAGVQFWGNYDHQHLLGVMGIQPVRDVHLIRHAYIVSSEQGKGIGSQLIQHLFERTPGPMLVGAWADAQWAIAFYQKHGFTLTDAEEKNRLLQSYWTVSPRQIETSVVLKRY